MTRRPRGALIVCEGIDGSGKTTVSRTLAASLAARGIAFRWSCEPTKTWLGEDVRRAVAEGKDPLAIAHLFMADHAEHCRSIRTHLDSGRTVISDRWSDSTHAYQGALLEDRFPDPVKWLTDAGAPSTVDPDLVIFIDIPVEKALARMDARGEKRERYEDGDFLRKVAANYARFAKERGYVVIDGDRPEAAVAADATAALDRVLGVHGII